MCIECSSSFTLQYGICLQNCVYGSYYSNNSCQPCVSNSINQIQTTIIKCASPFVLDYDGQCQSTCTKGFYAYQGICYMCNVECDTC